MAKVTVEMIQSRIKEVKYKILEGTTVTICWITMDNGFVFIGESACLNPHDFDKEKGEGFAYANAFEKIWEPMGFALADSK